MTSASSPRAFGLLHATALNMTNMIGIGPFITIPLLMSALGGPQAMLGWLVALVIVVCDGMVWSELGAAMPGSGGSFGYLRHGYGAAKVGRLMGFLFVWQFVLSGPGLGSVHIDTSAALGDAHRVTRSHPFQAADFLRKDAHGHLALDGLDHLEAVEIIPGEAVAGDPRRALRRGHIHGLDAADDHVGRAQDFVVE